MVRYRLTRAASDDIMAIFVNGVERFGLLQADLYHAGLAAAFERIAEYPFAVRLRRFRAHLILYDLVEENRPLILRVRHGREDWQAREEGPDR
ncbi:type II toxin-antitoxin system RelE/ParE family toxin [Sphingobium yanoikuyae]|jgi:toxin ParE1/3/4|uniref:type II toxin-antitoxin system RelE/ParE family toxin n=1 Tax=Sphingobium yanoikuyae TaxID=13690 RepID=UPI002FDEC51F